MSNHGYAKDFYLLSSINIYKKLDDLEEVCNKYKKAIDKAINTLEKGITFCENDSQGVYDICNIAINREKEILNILKGVSE